MSQPQSFYTDRLSALVEKICKPVNSTWLERFEPLKTFSPDLGEVYLGNMKLLPAMIQNLYVLCAEYRESVNALVDQMVSARETHNKSFIMQGKLPDAVCKSHTERMIGLNTQLVPLHSEYLLLDSFLITALTIAFNLPVGHELFGFRSDFQIVSCKNNARADDFDPMQKLCPGDDDDCNVVEAVFEVIDENSVIRGSDPDGEFEVINQNPATNGAGSGRMFFRTFAGGGEGFSPNIVPPPRKPRE